MPRAEPGPATIAANSSTEYAHAGGVTTRRSIGACYSRKAQAGSRFEKDHSPTRVCPPSALGPRLTSSLHPVPSQLTICARTNLGVPDQGRVASHKADAYSCFRVKPGVRRHLGTDTRRAERPPRQGPKFTPSVAAPGQREPGVCVCPGTRATAKAGLDRPFASVALLANCATLRECRSRAALRGIATIPIVGRRPGGTLTGAAARSPGRSCGPATCRTWKRSSVANALSARQAG
jgi:hypothetical protein